MPRDGYNPRYATPSGIVYQSVLLRKLAKYIKALDVVWFRGNWFFFSTGGHFELKNVTFRYLNA